MKNKLLLFCLITVVIIKAQGKLSPGFDAKEYTDLLRVSSQFYDSTHPRYVLPLRGYYKKVYRSPVVGLKNRFDIWLKDDNTGIISLRGTVADPESWMENFYMGMIPYKGSIKLNNKETFTYQIANDTNACVHLGWMVGLGHMAPDIVKQINELYTQGIRQFYIFGHSQGGALAYLLRSYLEYLDEKTLPKDIVYKTYCSAPPKPGNVYYSYDYDYITRNGWGYRVVNTEDWVPEGPFTVQTIYDVNTISPLRNRKESMGRLGFASKVYLESVYRKLSRATNKSMRLYHKYLGHKLYHILKKSHPEYIEPKYVPSVNYVHAGTPVILVPTPAYNENFKDDGQNAFLHHSYKSYLFIAEQNYPEAK